MPRIPGPGPVAGFISRVRSLIRDLRRRDDVEAEMREEFSHHIEMRTDDLMRQGLPQREAARRARLEFGHMETHRDRARAARGLGFFDQIRFSWLDIKLGLRMLVKHPWLTLAAVFALAVGIPVGLAPIHLSEAIEAPLPEDPGNRVRAIRYWDPATTSAAVPGFQEFEFWSKRLTTFSALAAFRTSSYNVVSEDGGAVPVAGAQVTASAFDILGRPPLTGRTLLVADQVPGAPDVVVIGRDLWASRFGSDPGVVGRTIRVGALPHTVVGIMPEGFLFPARAQLWLPLREEPGGLGRGTAVRVFGRLSEGVSPEAAQVELTAVGRPAIADIPEASARLQPEVVPFGMSFIGLPRGGLHSLPEFRYFQILAWMLLLVACGNVAMLVFARTATRFRELAVRTALGASRARIISQMFVEALLVAVLAAGLGVLSISWLLGRINLAALAGETGLPYWFSLDVSGATLVRALILAGVSATVAGVIPAIKITGRGIQQSIKRAESGRSGIRFGGVTSALIVADVAISVAAVGVALGLANRMMDRRAADALAGIPAEEYLAVEVRMPVDETRRGGAAEGRQVTQRLAATQLALAERLSAEPGVRGVAVADALPRMDHRAQPFEVDGMESPANSPTRWVRTVRVDVDFFDALSKPILAGRGFGRADLEGGESPVIVNTVFVDRVLGGRDPIGRRVRFTAPTGEDGAPWHLIVGVVGHLGANMVDAEGGEAVYLPAPPGTLNPVQFGIHVGASPERLAPRLRELAAEVDPNLILGTPVVLSEVYQGDWYILAGVVVGLIILVGILSTLAVSGIYAMMSFSVSERTREIGIRTALGAPRGALVVTILRRALVQLGAGALLGMPVAALILLELLESSGQGGAPVLAFLFALALAVGIVGVIGLVSCVVPTRRVLRVEACEALRADG
ncbi:MAG: ABC transporter permease [Longimicrobiales bacterium]